MEQSAWSQLTTLVRGLARSREHNPYELPAFAGVYERVISNVTHSATGQALLAEATAHAPDGGRVLDVGAGTGLDARTLARQRHDLEVVGAEPHGPMLDRARAAPDAPSNVRWVQAPASVLPFGDGHFDVIYSANAIKHFPAPREAVGEMLRVLAPGGLLLVAEIAPWVPLGSMWRVAARAPLPLVLRPLLALRVRAETRKLLPGRDGVEGWFEGHANTEPFAGLDHGEASGPPTAYWIARLRRTGR